MKRTWLLFGLMALFISACCTCTERECSSGIAQIDLVADQDLYSTPLNTASVRVYLCNADWTKIDSAEIPFNRLDQAQNTYFAPISMLYFPRRNSPLKDYHFIAEQKDMNRLDSIGPVNYRVVSEDRVCNECEGSGSSCFDQVIRVDEYRDPQITYRDTVYQGFQLPF